MHHNTHVALPDRQALARALAGRFEGSAGPFALLVLDVDRMHQVNHAFGFQIGDQLLAALGERLKSLLDADDQCFSLGGDEFAVVTASGRGDRDLLGMCRSLAVGLSDPLDIDGRNLRITVSIGVASFPDDADTVERLMRHADVALYRAKRLGGRNFQMFASELLPAWSERAQLHADLPMAVRNQQLRLIYQPILDLQTGAISALEAFVRWEHPALGLLGPDQFLALAEHTAVMGEIGAFVMRTACMDQARWSRECGRTPTIAINVSPAQLADPDLESVLTEAIAASGVAPAGLLLEITERALADDTEAAIATLMRLKGLGIQLALDDFGTGVSSLGMLKRFPFHKVKIDRSFVQQLSTSVEDAVVAKTIVAMSHNLGIRVIAEGVETELQCDFLRRNACDEIQGYLFSPAIDATAVMALLREDKRLASHLLREQKSTRTLLLVDDEENILSALRRLLRRDGYKILTANSGREGLELLDKHEVDVIMSDQRMPGMTGVEFLGHAKERYPDTIRIVLSGYTELQSVTDAVNEGAIYKFLTKPWDDTQLRSHVEEAFRRKELADENRKLNTDLRSTALELTLANDRLEELLRERDLQIQRDEVSLAIVREALMHVPLAVLGLDEDGVIAFLNEEAIHVLPGGAALLGMNAYQHLTELMDAFDNVAQGGVVKMALGTRTFLIRCHPMGVGSQARGTLLTFACA